MALLDEEAKKKVAAAVASAEETTAGELVVVEAPRSSNYASFRALVAALFTIPLVHELGLIFHDWPLALLSVGQLPIGWGLYVLLGRGWFLRRIVPRAVLSERAEQRAMRAFLETGVSETRDRSGVLIFLSEAEHRAVILADKGIHERVEEDEWKKDVDRLVQSLRAGDAVGGLLGVIERVGSLLAEKFPPRRDDTNELSNEVRRLD